MNKVLDQIEDLREKLRNPKEVWTSVRSNSSILIH
jgi:hypothetical protein